MSETPSSSTRSVTRTVPSRLSSARIRPRRWAASIRLLPHDGDAAGGHQQVAGDVAAGDQLDAVHGDRGGSSPWLMTNSQARVVADPAGDLDQVGAAPGSGSMPVSATSRSDQPVGAAGVEPGGDVPGGARRRPSLRVTAGSPAAGPSTYVATASAPASCRSSVQMSAVTASSPRPSTCTDRPVSSGRNSSVRTPSSSRNAPG